MAQPDALVFDVGKYQWSPPVDAATQRTAENRAQIR